MKCSKYPEREAVGQCMYSGKFFSSEELVDINGKMIGRDYVNLFIAEQSAKNKSDGKSFTFKDFILTIFTAGIWLIVWALKKD